MKRRACSQYYRQTSEDRVGVLIVYSVTDRSSFDEVLVHHRMLTDYAAKYQLPYLMYVHV